MQHRELCVTQLRWHGRPVLTQHVRNHVLALINRGVRRWTFHDHIWRLGSSLRTGRGCCCCQGSGCVKHWLWRGGWRWWNFGFTQSPFLPCHGTCPARVDHPLRGAHSSGPFAMTRGFAYVYDMPLSTRLCCLPHLQSWVFPKRFAQSQPSQPGLEQDTYVVPTAIASASCLCELLCTEPLGLEPA